MKPGPFNQRGFALIAAIFLLVVLAGLGVALASLMAVQHAGSAMDVQGARAYQSARAGIEWGLYQSKTAPSGCPPSPTSFVPLAGFTVTVTCVSRTYANATPSIVVNQLTATACNQPSGGACTYPYSGGDAEYVQRVMQATFEASPTHSTNPDVIYRRELHY